jgi:hypothetical protein
MVVLVRQVAGGDALQDLGNLRETGLGDFGELVQAFGELAHKAFLAVQTEPGLEVAGQRAIDHVGDFLFDADFVGAVEPFGHGTEALVPVVDHRAGGDA